MLSNMRRIYYLACLLYAEISAECKIRKSDTFPGFITTGSSDDDGPIPVFYRRLSDLVSTYLRFGFD